MSTTSQKVALVTGANRGIGLQICKDLSALGYWVIAAARDENRARAALAGVPNITTHALDVTDEASVSAIRQFVQTKFGRVDALVNNAGIFVDRSESILDVPLEDIHTTLETNVFGALRMCRAFAPMMRAQGCGRVVNISSEMGQLSEMSGGSPGYRMSKTMLNAMTVILAAEITEPNIKVNTCHPGWVKTDMGGPEAPRSPAEGADTAVWLALLGDDGPTGGFFHDRRAVAW